MKLQWTMETPSRLTAEDGRFVLEVLGPERARLYDDGELVGEARIEECALAAGIRLPAVRGKAGNEQATIPG